MPSWVSGLWAKVIAVGSFLLFILLAIANIFRKGEKAGEAKVIQKNTEAVQKATEQAHVVSDQVSKAADGSAAKDLESKWTR